MQKTCWTKFRNFINLKVDSLFNKLRIYIDKHTHKIATTKYVRLNAFSLCKEQHKMLAPIIYTKSCVGSISQEAKQKR